MCAQANEHFAKNKVQVLHSHFAFCQSNAAVVIAIKIVEYSQKAVYFCLTNFSINVNAKNYKNTARLMPYIYNK